MNSRLQSIHTFHNLVQNEHPGTQKGCDQSFKCMRKSPTNSSSISNLLWALLLSNLVCLFTITYRIQIVVTRKTSIMSYSQINGKMPSEIGHQFQNMVLYILYFKFWLCVLIEKRQLEAKSSLFRHCDSGYVLTRMRPSS